MEDKARIRRDTLAKRDSIALYVRKEKDALIQQQLLSVPEFINAKVVLFFVSFRSEVSTPALIEEALRLGKKVILPRVDREQRKLRLYEVKGMHELRPGFMGIPEPDVSGERERDINDADFVVMPGAAFDRSGNRLGYGAGYYDSLLVSLRRKIPLVALAYEEQIVESLPSEPHDIPVDLVVTDKRLIRC